MTPNEEQWLAEYHRREAKDRIKGLYRALWSWGAIAIVWLIILITEPEYKLDFADYSLLLVIIFNCSNAVREIIRNKRIAAGEKPAKTRESTESRKL